MEHSALRPYAAGGAALLGAALIAVIPVVAPAISHIPAQSPEVALASTADAFLDLANALDPSASTDGLIGVANNLDSFLDLFGNPTVSVADTLATDFVGYLDLGTTVNSIPSLLGTLTTDLTSGLITLESDIGNDFGTLETALSNAFFNLDSDVNAGFGGLDTDLGSVITGLDTINTSINTLETNNGELFDALEATLGNDLSPLTTIATDVGGGGVLAGELDSILSALNALIIVDS
jgi:hypothetical protein